MIMKKFICVMLIISVLFSASGCAKKFEGQLDAAQYEQHKNDYKNNKDMKTLAEILAYAYDNNVYKDIEEYGKSFYIKNNSEAEEILLACIFNYAGADENTINETKDGVFDSYLWEYVLLSMFNDDYSELSPEITDTYTTLKSVFNLFRTTESVYRYSYAESAIEILQEQLKISGLNERFYNLINLFSQETDKAEQGKIYSLLSTQYGMDKNDELYNYFLKYVMVPPKNDLKTIDSNGNGETDASLFTLTDNIKYITDKSCDFDGVCSRFGSVPKNVNGDGTLLVYKTNDYTVFINGLPVYSACIIKTDTGEIVSVKTN